MSAFYDLSKTPRNILNQAIVRAIVSENNGALFDPSDLSTLYQDAAGTTPVTAVEQPVGLMLDKSRGLMLGPELVSNGTFDSGLTGWNITSAGASTVTTYNGGVRITSIAADIAGITLPYDNSKRRHLLVEFDVLSITGIGYVHVGNGAASQVARYDFSTTGHKRVILYGDVVAPLLGFLRASTCDFVIDNISVRELYGYHATQSITASRPTLSARYNLLTKTEYFSDTVWNRNNINITSGQASPFGDIASKIIPTTTSGIHRIFQSITTGTGAKIFTCAIKAAGYATIQLQVTDNVAGDFFADIDLLTGNVTGLIKASVWVSASITTKFIGDGWILVTATGVNNTNPLTIPVINIKDRSSYAGDGVSGILLCIPDLRLGATSDQYQRVNTATDYDTDERYFKKYLRFDGVDDYLNLPYMGLYANGSASVVMGIDDRTQTSNSRVFSESSSTTSSQYSIRNLTNAGFDSYIADDAGVSVVDTLHIKGTESKNYIISVVDTGTNITRYRNSTSENAQSYSRAGKTVTANKTTIGALDTLGTIDRYTAMNLYGMVITISALTDSQRIACERHLSRKSGVQL